MSEILTCGSVFLLIRFLMNHYPRIPEEKHFYNIIK